MKIVCTIEARMKSSRLPGKVLLPVCGKPLLELMIERLRQVPELDGIVIATTADPSCQPIEDLAKRLRVGCFRGSEDDVLDRVLRSARSAQADLIVELTGDCPLMDPDLVSEVICEFRSRDVDYCANVLQRTHPRGMDVQAFPTKVLARVAELTNAPSDREHVSIYIYTHPELFRLHNVTNSLSPKMPTCASPWTRRTTSNWSAKSSSASTRRTPASASRTSCNSCVSIPSCAQSTPT